MGILTVKSIHETIDGRTYSISPLTMSGIGELQRFLDGLPYPKDPVAILAGIEADRTAGVIDDNEAKQLRIEAKTARMTWPPDVLQDPRTHRLFLYRDEGRAAFLSAALNPRPTREEAKAMAESISVSQFVAIYGAAMALDKPEEGSSSPKDAGPTGGPPPPSTTAIAIGA